MPAPLRDTSFGLPTTASGAITNLAIPVAVLRFGVIALVAATLDGLVEGQRA